VLDFDALNKKAETDKKIKSTPGGSEKCLPEQVLLIT